MKKLINEWQNFVNEEIYSSNAVVYHGTNSVANVKSILKNGYSLDKNKDAMYGKGLYTVYELEDTNTGAGIYGDVILKFKVDLKPGRFIILDEKEAKKVHGDDWKLRDQAQKFDLDLSKEIYEEYQKVMQYNNPMTSDIAKKIAEQFGGYAGGRMIDKIDGIVFTGRNDGPVCVVYNPEKSDLIAWKNISRKESVNEGDLVKFSYTHVNDIEQRLVNLKRSLDDKLLYGDEPANFQKASFNLNSILKILMRHNYMPAVDLVKKLPYVNVKKSNEKTASLGGEQVSFKKELGIQSLNPERKLELWDYIKNEFDSFRDFSGQIADMSIDFIETLEELKGEVVNVNEEKSKILVKVKWNNTTNEKNITKQYLNKLDVLEGRSMTKNWNREIDGQDIMRTIKKNKKQQSKSPDLPG